MLEREYNQLPKQNRKVYDLVLKMCGGNISRFAAEIGTSNQVINRLFKIDSRRGKYPSVSRDVQGLCIAKYDLPHSYFTDDDKPAPQTSPYYDNATIEGGFGTGDGREVFTLDNAAGSVALPDMPTGADTPYIKVHGRSMVNPTDPEHSIPDGAMIALRPANHTALNEIHWGEVYAFLTDDGAMVKKVLPSTIEGNIVCASLNEQEGYSPFELPASKIIGGLYYVAGVVYAKRWK